MIACNKSQIETMNKMRNLPKSYPDWKSVYDHMKSKYPNEEKEVFINGEYFTVREIEQALIDELLKNKLLSYDSAELIILAIDESSSITGADTKANLKSRIKQLIGDYTSR